MLQVSHVEPKCFPTTGKEFCFFFKLFFGPPQPYAARRGGSFVFFLNFFFGPPQPHAALRANLCPWSEEIYLKKKNGVPRRPTLAVDGWWHPCGILMIMPQMLLAGWMFGPRTDLSMFKNFVDGCLLFSPFGWFGGNFDMFLLRF